MNRQLIIDSIKLEKKLLKEKYGVEEIGIFGSYARGEETSSSDVDILVKLETPSLRNYFSLLDFLELKFKKKIDLITKHGNLSERFLRIISKDIIYV